MREDAGPTGTHSRTQLMLDRCALSTGFMCGTDFTPSKKLVCFARGAAATRTAAGKGVTSYAKDYAENALPLFGASVTTLVNLTVAHDGTTATITMAGPSQAWFGVGFNAKQMADAPYALIVDAAGAVTERKLVEHGPGTLLPATVKTVSSSVVDGIRTRDLSTTRTP